MNKISGYARVITDYKGKIIGVQEWYNYDENLDNYLRDVSFQDWIDESMHEDSEVLIIYKYWQDKSWTDCGYEYDSGLTIVDEILIENNYKQQFKKKIKKLHDELQKQEKELPILNDDFVSLLDERKSYDYLDSLIVEYNEIYDEDVFDENTMREILNKI